MNQKQASPELLSFMAELNDTLKKESKEPAHKELNRKWHEKNRPLDKTTGKAPERLNPEDSSHWRPEAKVTHVVKQHCRTCGDFVDFIGGEYIRFRSIMKFGGVIERRTETCNGLWLFAQEEALEERYEQHTQEVEKCVGCIKVEEQAVEIINAADPTQFGPELDLGLQTWKKQITFVEWVEKIDSIAERAEVRLQRRKQLAFWAARRAIQEATTWPFQTPKPVTTEQLKKMMSKPVGDSGEITVRGL